MRATRVALTYVLAIFVGVVVGLWVAGLTHVQCPPGLSTGNCLPANRLSPWEAALVGLAGAAAVMAAGITADAIHGRRSRG